MARTAAETTRVIAVNRFYWPDNSATSQILTDLMTHLARGGRPVTVISGRMLYDDQSVRLLARERKDGVEIRRVWTSRFGRSGLASRAIDYLTFYLSAFGAIFAATRRGDVILVKTDPPLISVVTWVIARMRGARVVTWNQDLFPEFASALGVTLAQGRFGRAMRWLRNRSLLDADMNVAINALMANEISDQGVDRARIRIIHNWSDARVRPVPTEDNQLRSAWQLDDTFVIAYSGNLGRAHIAEYVTELVRRTYDLPAISWLFIGGGSGLAHIERLIEETGATNIQIRPYQSRDDLSYSLSLADLHLVSLDPACEGLLMPSKLYGIMAAGRPTLFLGQADGALGREISQSKIGVSLDLWRPDLWRAGVETLLTAPEHVAAMGVRARALSDAKFHAAHALGAWSSVLAEVAARGRTPALHESPGGATPVNPSIGAIARDATAAPQSGLLSDLTARICGSHLWQGLRSAMRSAAFFALGTITTVLALYPDLHLPAIQTLKDTTDPLGHTAVFAALMLVGAATWGLVVPLVAGLSGFALWLELAQFLSPSREPDLVQVAGSLAGVFLGLILVRLWHRDRQEI